MNKHPSSGLRYVASSLVLGMLCLICCAFGFALGIASMNVSSTATDSASCNTVYEMARKCINKSSMPNKQGYAP
jgi:hypothetical protein